MKASHWQTPIFAGWKRDLDLKDVRFSNSVLSVHVEQESNRSWILQFSSVQAWKVTAEECADNVLQNLPESGSLFIVDESPWIRQLGECSALQGSKHFVICCYDEVLEVLAREGVVSAA